MNATLKQLASLVAACIVGGVIVYFAMHQPMGKRDPAPFQGEFLTTGRPDLEPSPTEMQRAATMSDEMYTAMRSRIAEAIRSVGAPNPEDATNAATEYAAFVADLDVDRMLALGIGANAIPHAETVGQFRTMIAGFPDRQKPAGWKTFNDVQILRWGFGVSRPARWESVVLETINATYFPAGPETPEFAAIWDMNPPDGYEFSGDATATFEIPDLYRQARMGEVASLLVSIAVQIERGDRWLITLHLAEYEPGKWYPVAYRKDAATSVDPFPSNRAPRPN